MEYEGTEAEVKKWIAYRDSGQAEHSMQIKLLQEELVDSQQNFEEMKGNHKPQVFLFPILLGL